MIQWPEESRWYAMFKDNDIFGMALVTILGLLTAYAFLEQSRPIGTIALLIFFIIAPYRAIYRIKIAPYVMFKKWSKQIKQRRNDNGIEIGIDADAFHTYFPDGTEEQCNRVITLLLQHKNELGITIDGIGRLYYLGDPIY